MNSVCTGSVHFLIDSSSESMSNVRGTKTVSTFETYPINPNIPREDALRYWFKHSADVCVAESDNQIVGSYTLHPNQSGGGAHIANAAFIVSEQAREQGIGRAMGEHCLQAARRLGF